MAEERKPETRVTNPFGPDVDLDVDPDAPPSAEELAESERLREALDNPTIEHRDAELARALHLAIAPKPIDVVAHRKILARIVHDPVAAQKRTTLWVFGGAIAAAAAVVLAVTALPQQDLGPSPTNASVAAPNLVPTHSAEDLFIAPFPKEQHTSERIDIIAEARMRDLRKNRYSLWGVKGGGL